MRLSVRVFGALLVLLLGVNDVAAQQVVTICGASSGYGYYLEPAGNGWTKDGISDGSLTVLRDTAGQYDVVIKSVGNSFTAKGDGLTARLPNPLHAPSPVMTLVTTPVMSPVIRQAPGPPSCHR
jgi:hypothetical protein